MERSAEDVAQGELAHAPACPARAHLTCMSPSADLSCCAPCSQAFVRSRSGASLLPEMVELDQVLLRDSLKHRRAFLPACKSRAKTMTPLRPHGRNRQSWPFFRTHFSPTRAWLSRPSSNPFPFLSFPGHPSPPQPPTLVARPRPADIPASTSRSILVACGASQSPCSCVCGLAAPRRGACAEPSSFGSSWRCSPHAQPRLGRPQSVGDVHTHHVYARDPTVT